MRRSGSPHPTTVSLLTPPQILRADLGLGRGGGWERDDDKSNLTTPTAAHEEHWREGGCAIGARKRKWKTRAKIEKREKKYQDYNRLTIADRGILKRFNGKLLRHILGFIDADKLKN